MATLENFLKPTGIKLVLILAIIVPATVLSMLFLGLFIPAWSIPWISFLMASLALGAFISYFLACIIDTYIKSTKLKIAIAAILGLVSIILAYVLHRAINEPVVCDPVHIPGPDDGGGIICDPVHTPSEASALGNEIYKNAVDVTAQAAQKLQECLRNCGL